MPPQSDGSKIYIIVLMISLLISGFNFFRAQSFDSDYRTLQKELNNVTKKLSEYATLKRESGFLVSDIRTVFESSSRNYSSNINVIDINPGGDYREFIVSGGDSIKKAELYPLSGNLLDVKLGSRICKDIKVAAIPSSQKNEAKIKVTTGSSTGYEILHFTNTVNGNDFYVLIMVADY